MKTFSLDFLALAVIIDLLMGIASCGALLQSAQGSPEVLELRMPRWETYHYVQRS
jgi:hypothetical protein